MPVDRKPHRPSAEALEPRRLLATIVVNSAGDADGADHGATLSLRQAIEISNGTLPFSGLTPSQAGQVVGDLAGPNTIDFAIPGAGPFRIAPTSPLPAITRPVTLDGYSQPGARPNTNGPGLLDDAVIRIELNGSKVTPLMVNGLNDGAAGLILAAGGITVKGFAINEFRTPRPFVQDSPGISLLGPGDDRVEGNFLGTDVTGTVALPNGYGIESFAFTGSIPAHNTIGGTTPEARNVISGNNSGGLILGPDDLVQGNFIGTDATGTKALPNGLFGISGFMIQSSGDSATIGGTVPGAGNLISGNAGIGLEPGADELIQGNRIGTDVTGSKALPNTLGISGGQAATIGGTAPGAGNLISGNTGGGLVLGSGSLVQGNRIGTDLGGAVPLPNGLFGISDAGPSVFYGDQANTVGGTSAGAGNLISGNTGAGIVANKATPRIVIQGNRIGTDDSGSQPLGNRGDGVAIAGTSNLVGGEGAGAGNVIAFNGGDGVSVGFNFYELVVGQVRSPRGFAIVDGSGRSNTVSGNAIFANQGQGLHLLDPQSSYDRQSAVLNAGIPFGPLPYIPFPNDPPFANDARSAPTITGAGSDDSGTTVAGTFNGPASSWLIVEGFANPPGTAQGKTYLGSTLVATDPTGGGSFLFHSPIPHLDGQSVTATLTDAQGNTSSFSNAVPIQIRQSSVTRLVGPSVPSPLGQAQTFAAVVSDPAGGIPTGLVGFAAGNVLLGEAPLNASGVAVFVTTRLPLGSSTVQATYLGDPAHALSPSNPVFAAVTPPVVAPGSPVASVRILSATSIKIRFLRPLSAATFQDPTLYRVIGSDVLTVPVKSARYAPGDRSVTLTLGRRLDLRRSYGLVIDPRSGLAFVGPISPKAGSHPTGPKGHATSSGSKP